MSTELSVDEMIVAALNSSTLTLGLDERVRNQMVAWVKCAADFGNNVDELAEQNRNLLRENEAFRLSENEAVEIISDLKDKLSKAEKELEKEKCELLGIIQRKDEVIRKIRNCHNCKNASFSYEDNHCNLLLTLQCRSYDKWELRQ